MILHEQAAVILKSDPVQQDLVKTSASSQVRKKPGKWLSGVGVTVMVC